MPDPSPAAGQLVLRTYRPGDDEAVLACHNAVFAAGANGRAARSLAHWRWKFRDNPTGVIAQWLAVHPTEGIVGVYAGLPATATCGGRRHLSLQAVDHSVRPQWLRVGGKHGLFAALGESFLAQWLGRSKDQALFVYGLPVAGWRTGARHLGWQIARDLDVVFRELPPGASPRAVPPELVVHEVARFGADADTLFAQLEPSFGVATVRDQRYLNWRYADHPDAAYTLFECRERAGHGLRGIGVVGTSSLAGTRTTVLVDWLQAADDGATMTAMLAAAEARAERDGTGCLASVWNPRDPRFLALQDHGYRVRGTERFLVVSSAVYDVVFFREQWYFTLGDTDLV